MKLWVVTAEVGGVGKREGVGTMHHIQTVLGVGEEWRRFGLHVLSLHIDIDIDFDKFDLR